MATIQFKYAMDGHCINSCIGSSESANASGWGAGSTAGNCTGLCNSAPPSVSRYLCGRGDCDFIGRGCGLFFGNIVSYSTEQLVNGITIGRGRDNCTGDG